MLITDIVPFVFTWDTKNKLLEHFKLSERKQLTISPEKLEQNHM
jgi:hypothetical protein